MKKILLILSFFILLIPVIKGNLLYAAWELPFGLGMGAGNVDKDWHVKAGQFFGVSMCLQSRELERGGAEKIIAVEMKVIFPPEIVLDKDINEIEWKGEIEPKGEKCLGPAFISKTDIKDWSGPIKGYAKFIAGGVRYTEEITWDPKEYGKGFVSGGLKERKQMN